MKKWTKILCCLSLFALMLAGCATVGNIKNEENGIIYNGNAGVMVGTHLYYGNAYSASIASEGEYKNALGVSYLSRLDTAVNLSVNDKDYSPKGVEKVAEEVVSHERSFMFVLGQYIYYATPNTRKDENATHYYQYTTLYKSKLNGDKKTALIHTSAEVKNIEALEFNGKYYIVMLAGDKLLKIDLEKGKTSEIATGVESVAIPKTYEKERIGSSQKWNGIVFYTVARSGETTGSNVFCASITGGTPKYVTWGTSTTISFVEREQDAIFFTKNNQLFMFDAKDATTLDDAADEFVRANASTAFFSGSDVEGINAIYTTGANADETFGAGYVFVAQSKLCLYQNGSWKPLDLTIKTNGETTNVEGFSVMFTTGSMVYLTTGSAIYSADVLTAGTNGTVSCTLVAEMEGMQTGIYAYDGKYVYFYAPLQDVDGDDVTENDSSNYLYRKLANGTGEYQLLGYTKAESRRAK